MSELKSSNPVFSQRVFNRSNRGFNEQKPKPHTDDSAAIVNPYAQDTPSLTQTAQNAGTPPDTQLAAAQQYPAVR